MSWLPGNALNVCTCSNKTLVIELSARVKSGKLDAQGGDLEI